MTQGKPPQQRSLSDMNKLKVIENINALSCSIKLGGTAKGMNCFACGNYVAPNTHHECNGVTFRNSKLGE